MGTATVSPYILPDDQNMVHADDETRKRLAAAMLSNQALAAAGAGVGSPVTLPDQTGQLPQTPSPDVTLAHANIADQPATADVNRAQANLEKFDNTPMWKRMLGPALIAAGSTLAAHSRNGLDIQQMGQKDIQQLNELRANRRQSLVNQLEAASGRQTQEYDIDQRNRMQDIIAQGNNQTRSLMAQIMAGSRRDVANTNAGAREYSADQGLAGRQYTADQGLTGREYSADVGARARVESARINAQAALERFLAGQQREDMRQARGFQHTDLKPTADEDRRADLSQALDGYADMLIDIAQRRPELFGPMAGRITHLRGAVGTDDADISELNMIREQLGIAQMGAHSMRSAQAIAPIADAMVNGFHNDADATIATLMQAKKGVAQFIGPQQRPTAFYPGGEQTNITPSATPFNPPAPRGAGATGQQGRTVTSRAAAQVGDIYNGFVYLGGDKNRQTSWGTPGKAQAAPKRSLSSQVGP